MSRSGYVHADGESLFVQHLSNTEAFPSRLEWAKKHMDPRVSMEFSSDHVNPSLIATNTFICIICYVVSLSDFRASLSQCFHMCNLSRYNSAVSCKTMIFVEGMRLLLIIQYNMESNAVKLNSITDGM